MPNQQPPGFSFYPGLKQEEAIRYLLNGRSHPIPEPPPDVASSLSVRLGAPKELALTQLSKNKGLNIQIRRGKKVAKLRTGWLPLVQIALDSYLDRECPEWREFEGKRAGGSKAGWCMIIHAALEEYLDQELPGWRE
jgi:hypothetical protein